MTDTAHKRTDDILRDIETRTAEEYAKAVSDMEKKLKDYLEETESARKVQEALLKSGKISKQEYQNWCYSRAMTGQRWQKMLDVLTSDMHHANEIAAAIASGRIPDIYALNANFGTYLVESGGRIDTGFTLYNHETAEELLGDMHQLMPRPSQKKALEIASNPDMQWNREKIQSCVFQGVVQGESPFEVAARLRTVGQMNYHASIRYARTMGTSAQNMGRYDSFKRAVSLGVELIIEWMATLDGRTRHSHRVMHGQRTTVDKPFYTPDGYTIYYPADCSGSSDAPQKEIWNCRCTLLAWVKGFEEETVKSSPKMGGMSFDEWVNAKESKQNGKVR